MPGHWCHHFASSPPETFTDGNWARFAKLAGVDLRSLPLSFLVLDQRPAPQLPAGATRIIGRPRVYKPHALLLGCDETGVRERTLARRTLPAAFRRVQKGNLNSVEVMKCDGDTICQLLPFAPDNITSDSVSL